MNWKSSKDWLIVGLVVLALGAVGLAIGEHRAHAPAPPPDPTAGLAYWGRHYGPTLARSEATGWDAAADAMAQGKSVADCMVAKQSAALCARQTAFATLEPKLAAVLPEGAEPKDDADRARVANAWRAFASGLKGGK